MRSLCTKSDLKKVADRIGRLVSIDALDEHRQMIAPMAAQCKNQILTHEFEHKQMKEMIRRFDEVLSVKANNYTLKELEKRIGENFLK